MVARGAAEFPPETLSWLHPAGKFPAVVIKPKAESSTAVPALGMPASVGGGGARPGATAAGPDLLGDLGGGGGADPFGAPAMNDPFAASSSGGGFGAPAPNDPFGAPAIQLDEAADANNPFGASDPFSAPKASDIHAAQAAADPFADPFRAPPQPQSARPVTPLVVQWGIIRRLCA